MFDGSPPALKRRTLAERFRQRYKSQKNYKKLAQRLILNAVERRPQKRSSNSSQLASNSIGDDSHSQYLEYSRLTGEQEASILKMLEDFEDAMEQRQLEEVGLW